MTGEHREVIEQARHWQGRADDAGLLARALLALDAQLTAVEKERDEAWWHAAHNDEKAVTAEKEKQRLREVLIRLGQFARREIDAALSQDTSC